MVSRAVVAAVLVAAVPAVSARATAPPLYGTFGPPSSLARLDPGTLRPDGRRVRLDGHAFGWSFSPDGSRAAAGTDGTGELRLYDLRLMRVLGDVELGEQGLVFATAWAGPRRVLAVVVTPGCCGLGETTVVGVDAPRRKVVWRRSLRGSFQDGGRFRRSLVLLLGPKRTVGGSRLAVVAPDGRVRTAPLPAIRSGTRHSGGNDPATFRSEIWNPGLALDASGRAFVVQRAAPVAEVDLRDLRVRLHAPVRGTLAAAKADSGPTRFALWLGNGLLAVTGTDDVAYEDARGRLQQRETAAGLKLVDTRSWRIRTLDRETSRMAFADGTLLGYGLTWDSRVQKLSGGGLRGYRLDGTLRFHRYAGEPISAALPLRHSVLVAGAAGSRLFAVGALVDPATGRELRRLKVRVNVLAGDEPFWY